MSALSASSLGIALVALITLLAAFVGTAAWRWWALRRGVLDVPGARSSHESPTPRGAGVGLLFGVFVGWALLGSALSWSWPEALSLLGIAALGLYDDLRGLAPRLKLSGQVLCALPIALAHPLWPEWLGVAPGALLSLSWVVFLVNAWNFMDGINGIAAGAAAAVAVSLAAFELASGGPLNLGAVLLVAACLGFLPMNLPKARVFMGDCGSHALGMLLALLALGSPSTVEPWMLLALAAPFVIDVAGTLVLRALKGEQLTEAHRRHLYQLVTRSGYSHAKVTGAYVAWMLVTGGVVVASEYKAGFGQSSALVMTALTAILWVAGVRHFGRRLGEWGV
jgi:UDP-N-acetylmuramyl pentapeptide phosphotransferase/UDP-N-acetylglucosamine-1-phosphate transferase